MLGQAEDVVALRAEPVRPAAAARTLLVGDDLEVALYRGEQGTRLADEIRGRSDFV